MLGWRHRAGMATGRSRSGSRPDDEPSGSWMEGSRSGHYELAPDSAPAGGGRGVGRDGENREAGRERATSGQGQQDLTGARACQCADDPKGRGGRTRWRCERESGRGCEVAGVHDELEVRVGRYSASVINPNGERTDSSSAAASSAQAVRSASRRRVATGSPPSSAPAAFPRRRSRPDPQRERGGSTPLHDLSRGADHRIRQDHAPAAQGLRRRITLSRGRGRRARCICRDADHARRPGAVTAFAHGPLRAADPQSPGEVRGSTVLRSPLAPACFPLLAPACSLSGRSTATMAPSSMCGSGTRQRAESFPCERATTRAHLRLVPLHLRLVPLRFDGSPCRTPAVVQVSPPGSRAGVFPQSTAVSSVATGLRQSALLGRELCFRRCALPSGGRSGTTFGRLSLPATHPRRAMTVATRCDRV